jgi:methoxymalonate biosynthesis acyl carrier protein
LGRYVDIDECSDSDDVFALGLVNSLLAVQLATFVEKQFQVVLLNEDLRIDNFRSIDAIIRLLEVRGVAAKKRVTSSA